MVTNRANGGHQRLPAAPRRLQIAGLLVLAPVCAEYLAAYDNTTGDAVVLIGGLIIFAPLYGAPALLIREVARRAGLGWTGIILLAAAFGLIEAGIVDQSLFSLDYRDIASWDEGVRGTFIGPLGLSAYNALNFLGGHVIYSICAPIALVEAFRPAQQREPWLSVRMLVVVALFWLGASALVLSDSLLNEISHASPYQVAGSAVVVGLLILAAFRYGRPTTIRDDRRAPRVRTVFLVALVVGTIYNASPTTWPGFAFSATVLVGATILLHRAAQSPSWDLRHVVAVASAALVSRAVLAFTYFPLLGDVSPIRKYGHNIVLLTLVSVVCVLAFRAADTGRPPRAPDTPRPLPAEVAGRVNFTTDASAPGLQPVSDHDS